MSRSRPAFTLIELLVVVSLIVLLVAMLLPALGRARRSGRVIVCASNVSQIDKTLTNYAADNNRKMPADQHGNWMWDMSIETSDELTSRNANKWDMFYCPEYAEQNVDGLWHFNPNFRVTGYFYTYRRSGGPMASAANGNPRLLGGQRWIRHVNTIDNPSEAALVTDATIAFGGNFTHTQGGWPVAHRSSHLDTDNATPVGGNIAFLDGHVEWRHFEDMQLQYNSPEHWF